MTDFYRAIGLDPRTPPHVLADQITALLRQTAPGPNYDYLQQARAVLGSPQAKANYDAWLSASANRTAVPGNRTAAEQTVEYLKRFVGMGTISLSPREITVLEQAGVRSIGAQRLLAWRRAMLVLLLPFLVVYAVLLALGRFGDGDTLKILSALGLATQVLPALAMLVLAASVIIAVIRWTQLGWVHRLLFWSWLVSTVIPLVSYLFPLSWYFDASVIENRSNMPVAEALAIARPGWIVTVTLLVIPVAFSLLSGVLRGVRRVKSLLPASSLPGWFLAAIASIYAAVLLAAYSMLAGTVDNVLLLCGGLAIIASPLVYVAYRRRYIQPMTHAEAAEALRIPSILAMGCTLLGAILLTIYALTGELLGRRLLGSSKAASANEAWASYWSLPTIGLSVFVRFTITSVVIAFAFVAAVRTDRKLSTTMSNEVQAEFEKDTRSLSI